MFKKALIVLATIVTAVGASLTSGQTVMASSGVSLLAAPAAVNSQMVDPDGHVVPVRKPTGKATEVTSDRRMPNLTTVKKPGGFGTQAACVPECFSYAGARAAFTAPNLKQGARIEATIQKTNIDSVDWPGGGHVLTELSMEDVNRNIVEVGFWVYNGNGDGYPHIFVHNWKLNVPLGYNGGGSSGYLDNAAVSTFNAGDNINSLVGTSKRLVLQYVAPTTTPPTTGGWWVGFDTVWIGVFPNTDWTGTSFAAADVGQAFGEIASEHYPTCSDIGNGNLASTVGTYPTSGAELTDYRTFMLSTGTYQVTALGIYATDATKWNTVFKGVNNSIKYGGPGFVPPNCP